MSTLIRSSVFSDWLNRLKDQKAKAPRFETIATIMRALNVGFSVSRLPVRAKKARKLKAA